MPRAHLPIRAESYISRQREFGLTLIVLNRDVDVRKEVATLDFKELQHASAKRLNLQQSATSALEAGPANTASIVSALTLSKLVSNATSQLKVSAIGPERRMLIEWDMSAKGESRLSQGP